MPGSVKRVRQKQSFGVIAQLVEGGLLCNAGVCQESKTKAKFWGHSSVGRAPALQAGGRQFESDWLHQDNEKGDKIPFLSKQFKVR